MYRLFFNDESWRTLAMDTDDKRVDRMRPESQSSLIDKSLSIVIVGGGLAGFAVGIALMQHGFTNLRVYERDKSMECRRQGYGLTLLQGVTALRRLGIYDQVAAVDTPSRSHFIFDASGDLIGFFGTCFTPPPAPTTATTTTTASSLNKRKTTRKHNLHISRQQLRTLLIQRYVELHPLGTAGIEWSRCLLSVDMQLGECRFQDDVRARFDILVGCDGIRSLVRQLKYPDPEANRLAYLGIVVVLGITRTSSHWLTRSRVFQTMDGCTRLFAMPFASTATTTTTTTTTTADTDKDMDASLIMWQLSFPMDECDARTLCADQATLKEHVSDRCGSWHAPIPQMIESTPLANLMGIVAYDRDPHCVHGACELAAEKVVLLGDAAHPMSPFKGQGANQALIDAVAFADQLVAQSQSLSIGKRIEAFETSMWTRVAAKVAESRERAVIFHRSNVLHSDNFAYRGVDARFVQELNARSINALYNEHSEPMTLITIEEAIQQVMSSHNISQSHELNTY